MSRKLEFASEVRRLATERDAVILAHNYQPPEIQDVADHVGDSLALARLAAASSSRTIVLAGVWFMAETAKILCPERTVLIPSRDAGCSLADSVTAAQLREWKARHPGDQRDQSWIYASTQIDFWPSHVYVRKSTARIKGPNDFSRLVVSCQDPEFGFCVTVGRKHSAIGRNG